MRSLRDGPAVRQESTNNVRAGRPFDVILYGATAFTGRATARRLASLPGLRWALAGRSEERLRQVAAALPEGAAPSIRVCAVHDEVAVDALARDTHVLASCAGPFRSYGSALVAAAVRHGTHWCDITGESPWVAALVRRHHEAARASGSRVVPCCGFDSVPSDLGVYLLLQEAERRGRRVRCARGLFRARGTVLGGSFASALDLAETGRGVGRPDLLGGIPGAAHPPDRRRLSRHPTRGTWLAPFVMEFVNTRVVRRTALLRRERGDPGVEALPYEEAWETRSLARALGMTAALTVGLPLLRLRAVRAVARRLGPAPGDGPDDAALASGFWSAHFEGLLEGGGRLGVDLRGLGDPGVVATSAFLAAAIEAQGVGDGEGGVLTPVAAFGGFLTSHADAMGVAITTSEGGPA